MVDPLADRFRVTRLIATSLVMGVTLFWIVAWVLTDGGSQRLSEAGPSANLLLLVWGTVAVPAFGMALHFRAAGASARRPGLDEDDTGSSARAQVATIVAHALLEGPALLGGVLFLLYGDRVLGWCALPVYGLGVQLTWPQREWFSHR